MNEENNNLNKKNVNAKGKNTKLCKTEMKIKNNFEGITLIALVVTIVVLLILAGVTINSVIGDNGIIAHAKIAKITQELSSYKESMEMWALDKSLENEEFKKETITGYQDKIYYKGKAEDSNEGIRDILGNVSDAFYTKLEIIKGELYISTTDKTETRAAEIVGIKVSPFDIKDGVLLSTGNNLNLVTGLNEVTIPPSVTSIGEGAFANVENLTSITIPGTVKRIEANAFAYNTSLVNVTIEEGVEYIGASAFGNCKAIKTVKLPNTVAYIENYAFYGNSALKQINIPNTVTYIGSYTFSGDTALEQINIPSSIEYIKPGTFSYCQSLKEIAIPEGIKEIQTNAFVSCTSLTTVKLPSTVTAIDGSAFNKTAVSNIVLAPENTSFTVAINSSGKTTMLLGNNGTEMSIILDNATDSGTFDVPNGVTTLKSNQIDKWKDIITTVKIPASVNNISGGFFTSKITEVNIDGNNEKYSSNNTEKSVYGIVKVGEVKVEKELVRYYGTEAEVTVKKGIETIKSGAFSNNTVITKLTFPDSVVKLEDSSVSGARNLKSLRIGKNLEGLTNGSINGIENIDLGGNTRYSIRSGAKCNGVVSNALYNGDGTVFISPLKQTSSIQTYEIPEGVTKIEESAFYYATQLTQITIPDGVTKIESMAFLSASKLTQITIPDGIKSIGNSCFSNCRSLTSIEIPSSIETIGAGCFSGTNNLKSIRIHKKNGEVAGAPWGSPFGNDGKVIIWDM